ncbi:MSHA biogenesis protein MshP [Shewanella violacea DSS12]|uniref:MSHA biogenesis protein MshP n=2 Tax=Shewanella violacea TaxID=60217 RepID=D4ZEP1_SHEVD|nr:MSHA biogenesis protein MshP [Shewanella violacea DSS12]
MNQDTHKTFRGLASRPLLRGGMAKQQGSALVIGVFVITVMFLMASALINILEDADEQVNLEVWGIRALAAANSGADSALALLFPLDASAATCDASSQWLVPDVPGFHACIVELTCVDTQVDTVHHYRITSTATCETGNCTDNNANCLRVNRQVEVEARD